MIVSDIRVVARAETCELQAKIRFDAMRIESLPQRQYVEQLMAGLGSEEEDRIIQGELQKCLRASSVEAGPSAGIA